MAASERRTERGRRESRPGEIRVAHVSGYDTDGKPSWHGAGSAQVPAVPERRVGSVETAYARYVVPIYRFLYSRLGNQEEAEDLTSEVFLKAVRQLEPERDGPSVEAWLYQVARTTLADYWRRRSRVPEDRLGYLDVLDALGTDPLPTDRAAIQFARWLLDQLPERYRQVLSYRFLRGYSIKETAQAMDISGNHVKVLQHRAVQRAAALGREYGGPRG
jgi:RNA polymerase sigma-70 factor (ECF subfamily)